MKRVAFIFSILLLFILSMDSVSSLSLVKKFPNENVVISFLVENTGTEALSEPSWYSEIDAYKVPNYQSPSKSGKKAEIYYYSSAKWSCYGEGNPPNITGCICYHNLMEVGNILDPGETWNITCEIPASYFEPTDDLEAVVFWAWDQKDGYILSEKSPVDTGVKIVLTPSIAGEVSGFCGGSVFLVKVFTDSALNNVKVNDELYAGATKIDQMGEKSVGTLNPPGIEYTWTSTKTVKGVNYKHKLTLSYDGGSKTYEYNFNCTESTATLTVDPTVDATGKLLANVMVQVDGGTPQWTSEIKPVLTFPGLSTLKTHYIKVFSTSGRPFSHFWDHNCSEENEWLDTASNPYTFTLYGDRQITPLFKTETEITVNYDGSSIRGTLTDEKVDRTGIYSSGHYAATCGGSETLPINTNVDLYYYKDETWYYIGSAESNPYPEDGYWSYDWQCIPGVEKIKAVYVPTAWYYVGEESVLETSCDFEITRVMISNEPSPYPSSPCWVDCSDGTCDPVEGNCPSFKCGDNIYVYPIIRNNGDFRIVDAKVDVTLVNINDNDPNDITNSITIESGSFELNPGSSKEDLYDDFPVPAHHFEEIKEGRHVGFWVNLKGKIQGAGTPFIEFPPVGDNIENRLTPRIDNSLIYRASSEPHIDYKCEPTKVNVGSKVNCTVTYTHPDGESGRIHVHWRDDNATYVGGSVSGCLFTVENDMGMDGYNYEGYGCDVNSGDTVFFQIQTEKSGPFNVHFRAQDSRKDEWCGDGCDYSRYSESCTQYCYGSYRVIDCDSVAVPIAVELPPATLPKYNIIDIFSSDSKVVFSLINEGGDATSASTAYLYIDDMATSKASLYIPKLSAGDMRQFMFDYDWKKYCFDNKKETITVRVKEGLTNKYRDETWDCIVPVKDSECMGIFEIPSNLTVGDSKTARVRMKNVGSGTWTTSYKLRSQNPPGNNRWGISEIGSGNVNPGSSYDFEFTATAPSTPGDYVFDWRMVDESGNEFGDTCSMSIHVYEPAKADLTVLDMWVSGDEVWYTVKNIGVGSAPASYSSLYVDGIFAGYPLGEDSAPSLDTGVTSYEQFSFKLNQTTSRDYTVKVCVDTSEVDPSRSNIVKETNENNNCRTETLHVAGNPSYGACIVTQRGGTDVRCFGYDSDADGKCDSDYECAIKGICMGYNWVDSGVWGARTETNCKDFIDNDCDGLTDCADENCAGQLGPLGFICCVKEADCYTNFGTDQRIEDTGDINGGGVCKAENVYCLNNICQKKETSGTDYCAGTPDRPEITYYTAEDTDGNELLDTCVAHETRGEDICSESGITCSATDWQCNGNTLIPVTSSGTDACSVGKRNIIDYVCSNEDGGVLADTCKPSAIECPGIEESCYCDYSGGMPYFKSCPTSIVNQCGVYVCDGYRAQCIVKPDASKCVANQYCDPTDYSCKNLVAAKPDLIILDIYPSGNYVGYQIKNRGNASAGQSTSELRIDEVSVKNDIITSISADQNLTRTFDFNWTDHCYSSGKLGQIISVKVCAEKLSGESDIDNNCREEVFQCPLPPSPAPTPPDLEVLNMYTSGNRIRYVMKNYGQTQASSGSDSKLWVDGVEKDTDTNIPDPVPPGQQLDRQFNTFDWITYCSGKPNQMMNVRVCVDVNNEIDEGVENNNCREESFLCPPSSPPAQADIIILDIWPSGDYVKYRIKNRGNAVVPANSDTGLWVDDISKMNNTESSIPAQGSLDNQFNFNWTDYCVKQSKLGQVIGIKICADINNEVVDESDEDNNCREEVFQCPPPSPPPPPPQPTPPDLVVLSIYKTGDFVSYVAINYGETQANSGTDSRLFLNDVEKVTDSDLPAIPGGVSIYRQTTFNWKDYCNSYPGTTNALKICADINNEVVDESDEDNNCREEDLVCPTLPPPSQADLVIPDIYTSGNFISYNIANQGNTAAGRSYSQLWVDGISYDRDDVPGIVAGQSKDRPLSFDWTAYCQAHLGENITLLVCADVEGEVTESNENNNCREEDLACPSPPPEPCELDVVSASPPPYYVKVGHWAKSIVKVERLDSSGQTCYALVKCEYEDQTGDRYLPSVCDSNSIGIGDSRIFYPGMIADEPYLWNVYSCSVSNSSNPSCSDAVLRDEYEINNYFINHPSCDVCPGENDWCALYGGNVKFNRSTDDKYFIISEPGTSVTITLNIISGDFNLYADKDGSDCASPSNYDPPCNGVKQCTFTGVTSTLIRITVVNNTPSGFYNISATGAPDWPYRTAELKALGVRALEVPLVTTTTMPTTTTVPVTTTIVPTTTTLPTWKSVQLGIVNALRAFFGRIFGM
jgi:hypothetical protein